MGLYHVYIVRQNTPRHSLNVQVSARCRSKCSTHKMPSRRRCKVIEERLLEGEDVRESCSVVGGYMIVF